MAAGTCVGRRLAAWSIVFASIVSAPLSAQTPSGCIDISDQPPSYSGIEFAAAIQTNIFNAPQGCADCHTTSMGTQSPSGQLDLDAGDDPPPYANVVNVASPMYSGYTYVVPKHPERSLLFLKVNCAHPGAGSQMPKDGYPTGSTVLTTYQMAQLWDWIAEGAPVQTTDGIFQGTFDIRGLFVNKIFANGFESP